MANPASYRPATKDIPTDPGVYRFRDEFGRVIYVGKAKNLRNRLTTYFQDPRKLHPRTNRMVHAASSVQWTVVSNEVEALTLEYSWIKEFRPKFNVMYNRNDMSFPYLAVTMQEEFPRAQVMRGKRRAGVQYFGPFPQAWTIRETLEHLTKIFPVRTCSSGVFARAQRAGRPCLLGHIGRCAAPCAGWVTAAEHREIAADLCRFMNGKTGPVLRDLKGKMQRSAELLEFERAAALRDQIEAIQTVLAKNTVVLNDGTDADVIGVSGDELETSVYVLNVRGGRIRGVRSWVHENAEDLSIGDTSADVLEQLYGDLPNRGGGERRIRATEKRVSVDDVEHLSSSEVPALVLLLQLPHNRSGLASWLKEKRGSTVTLIVPQRGPKKKLLKMAEENAAQALRLHKTKRAGDLTRRSVALTELAELLQLEQPPLRIEGFDISHLQGTEQVASMVVFEDGAPARNQYRQFKIRAEAGKPLDDTAAMEQVLRRRLQRLRAENAATPVTASGQLDAGSEGSSMTTGPLRFSYPPDLLVVDGGLPQVNAAARAIAAEGFELPVIGLAKRLEEIWIPGEEFPVIAPRTSAALYLLQHLRDESHRRAITHHRGRRTKALQRSVLDSIEGVGPQRAKQLLSHFGTFKKLRAASAVEISQVKGISESLAQRIWEKMKGDANDAAGAG